MGVWTQIEGVISTRKDSIASAMKLIDDALKAREYRLSVYAPPAYKDYYPNYFDLSISEDGFVVYEWIENILDELKGNDPHCRVDITATIRWSL